MNKGRKKSSITNKLKPIINASSTNTITLKRSNKSLVDKKSINYQGNTLYAKKDKQKKKNIKLKNIATLIEKDSNNNYYEISNNANPSFKFNNNINEFSFKNSLHYSNENQKELRQLHLEGITTKSDINQLAELLSNKIIEISQNIASNQALTNEHIRKTNDNINRTSELISSTNQLIVQTNNNINNYAGYVKQYIKNQNELNKKLKALLDINDENN